MITGAFNKRMTNAEAERIVSEALFSDDKNFEDYVKDFTEWLGSDLVIRAVCAG